MFSFTWRCAGQGEQCGFAGAGDEVVYQAFERALPVRLSHPGGDEPSAQDKASAWVFASDESNHGEGAQGLAEKIHGKAHQRGALLFEQVVQSSAEIGIEGILFGMFGGPDEVLASHGG